MNLINEWKRKGQNNEGSERRVRKGENLVQSVSKVLNKRRVFKWFVRCQ